MSISERSQTIILWWAFWFMVIFAAAWWALLGMVPTPPADWNPAQVAAFYTENGSKIKLGAAIASWTSAFMVPFSTVVAIQLARLEEGTPVWSILAFAGGILMCMFLVFPPILWGVAAFNPARLPDATALMNDLANLTLTTTDQFYIFQMIAITYVGLTSKKVVANSAFPRWLGWLTLWAGITGTLGCMAQLFKTGPFAWDGIFPFYLPIAVFGAWMGAMAWMMFRALNRQEQLAES